MMGRIKTKKGIYRELEPKNDIEFICRFTIDGLNAKIDKEHCQVCGDTLDDGDLFQIKTDKGGLVYFCEYCYNCQMKM